MLMHRKVWTPERIAERDARHDKIDKCIEAGLCYICDQAVADGAALHGPTGAHWECHRAPFEGVDNLSTAIKEIDRLLGVLKPVSTDTHPRLALANGGQLVHFVIPATGTSLCGHKPRDTATHMRSRGRWRYWKLNADVPGHMKQCPKCKAKAMVSYPPLEDESKKDDDMATYEGWADSVKRQMIELGMTISEATFAVDENEQWFIDQYEAGAGTGITADEWFIHHHNAE